VRWQPSARPLAGDPEDQITRQVGMQIRRSRARIFNSQLPAIHTVITQAISAPSESDREHLLSSLTTIRAGPTAVEVSTVNDLTGRIHHIPPPDSENSAVSRHGLFDAVPPDNGTPARPQSVTSASGP
jgi:hypothetical protein